MKNLSNTYTHIGEITLPLDVVKNCSHAGDCKEDVIRSMELPEVKEIFDNIPIELIDMELIEQGIDMSDKRIPREMMLWIICNDIAENNNI
jgi:hypothetical protein